MSYLFSGKIKCGDCGKNYRGRLQRQNKVYICSGYSNQQTSCERFAVKEDELIDIIKRHFESDEINIENIKLIKVENKQVTIIYSDDSKSIISSKQYKV